MTTINTTVMSLLDLAKRTDPNGKRTSSIVELLAQSNEMLADMVWREGNQDTGHRITVRTGLPSVTWRLLNQGVTPSKSSTAQIEEKTGILEAWSEVEEEVAKLGGDINANRLSEGMAFLESMNQEMQQTLIYGNSGTAPEEFMGLAPRYATKSGATNGANVIDGGGVGNDNTSIWLVYWGENSVFGLVPKGSKAGIQHTDFGLQTVQGANGIGTERMRAYQERWQWKAGIALKDWRYVVRIANIDVSNMVAQVSAADLLKLMALATHVPPTQGLGKPVFYMNRSVFAALDVQRFDAVQVGGGITYDNVDGKRVYSFRGIPIRIVDSILETEARVV